MKSHTMYASMNSFDMNTQLAVSYTKDKKRACVSAHNVCENKIFFCMINQ